MPYRGGRLIERKNIEQEIDELVHDIQLCIQIVTVGVHFFITLGWGRCEKRLKLLAINI